MQSLLSRFEYSFRDQKPTIMLFGGDGTHYSARKTSRDNEKEKQSPFSKKFLSQPVSSKSEPAPKRLKCVQKWKKLVRFPLVDDLSNKFNFQIILFTFNLQSTATQLTINLQKIMIFSVSNDGIQWTLDFGPDSVTIAVNDLDQNITISSKEIPLAAWQLLLSQKQDLLNNHLARVSSNYSQPTRYNGDERRSTLQCGSSRLGH